MRKLYALSTLITLIVSMLTACTTHNQPTPRLAANFINRESVQATTKEKFPAKNPQTVAIYKEKPLTPYRIIGVAKVAKYNFIGLPRKEETLQDMMKHLAASIGGDGLINVNANHDGLEAKVIQFQRILL